MNTFIAYKKLIYLNDKNTTINNIVNFCKDNFHLLNIDSEWDDLCWKSKYCFYKIDKRKPLDTKFADFAKIYCFYKQIDHNNQSKTEISSMKCIEQSLIECKGDADITKLDIPTLDRARHIALSHYAESTAYRIVNEISKIAEFTSDIKLTIPIIGLWKPNVKRSNDNNRISLQAKKDREEKLPTDEAVAALMELFNNYSKDPSDIFVTCFFALTMCAPSRAGEILNLSVNCEFHDVDSKNRPAYGWRFEGAKGFGPTIKWIPKQMWMVSQVAIQRIKKLTNEPRKLAKWLENGNTKFYKHPGYPQSIKDENQLTANEIRQLTSTIGNLPHYAKVGTSLDDLWLHVSTKKQPKSFPYFVNKDGYTLKFSEALFCMSKYLLSSDRATSKIILFRPTVDHFNSRVSGTQDDKKTIFEKYGYINKDGSKIHLTSHMMRHLISTMGNRANVEYSKMAQWACRVSVEQNETYNHMSDAEKVEKIKQVYNLTIKKIPLHTPVNIEEFNAFYTGPVQVSEYGFCLHEYSLSPCIKYNNCINCNEHICVKGDQEKEERIVSLFKQIEVNLKQAERDLENGLFGVDKWYKNHQKNYDKLSQLINILQDKTIEDGSVIRLNNEEFTIIDRSYKLITCGNNIDHKN